MMKSNSVAAVAFLVGTFWFSPLRADEATALSPVAGTVATGAGLIEVYADDAFFEGPCWDPTTRKLYFTAFFSGEKPNQQILRLDAGGKAQVWLDATQGVNGTWLSNDGRLLGAQAYGHRVMSYAIGADGPSDTQTLLFDETLNQPNDVCQTPSGNIYFTDPDFTNRKTSAVYLRAPNGQVRKIISDMPVPNGVIASLDGTTLYVGDSHQKLWRAYPLDTEGNAGKGREFFNPQTDNQASPDGMSIDELGNLYLSGRGGVWVVNAKGESLGLIEVPEFCSNVTFGGDDGKTLYLTCAGKVYSLQMKVRGGQFAGLKVPAPVDDGLGEIPRLGAMTIEQAQAGFQVQDGFRMDLLAHEPLVSDPVDMAYDENGLAYVAEMRGYPYPETADAVPTQRLGRIRVLRDIDGDGTFDESHVLVDRLFWPTSVTVWKGGVFVTAAPDIWYFKDTDGDFKADIRRKVFTGFGRRNVQAIVNNLKFGLDHRIYGAASGNGGRITPADAVDATPIVLRRSDFRFDPVTEQFEATSGGARFGNSFDDWGNRFLCNIRNPAQHVVLPAHYLARNRYLSVATTIHDVASAGEEVPVYRISPVEPWREIRARRWVAERVNYPRSELVGAGFFTSSSGVTVYRGSAYPATYLGNVFVSDVAGNLVHRQGLEPNGVTFDGTRADARAEFVASTDTWFRPVNYVNAPDGTLHVLDMYRETIEHPWSIPDDIKAKLDLESGNHLGRIYRLTPPDFQSAEPVRLGDATTSELVALLDHANAWQRETAHRLLFERQDASAVPALRAMVHSGETPQARVHALWSLAGLQALTDADLLRSLNDSDAHVREHAVQLSEQRLQDSLELRQRVMELANDAAPRVRFQVAFSVGELTGDDAVQALASIAARDGDDSWIRTAVLSSSGAMAEPLLRRLLADVSLDDPVGRGELLRNLALFVGAGGDAAEIERVLEAVVADDPGKPQESGSVSSADSFAVVTGLGDGFARRRIRLADAFMADSRSGQFVRTLLDSAVATAVNRDASIEKRVQAIELLKHDRLERLRVPLVEVLGPEDPREVQLAAVGVLAGFAEADIADLLLQQWKQLTPPLQMEVVERLSSRTQWMPALLTALEAGLIQPGQVPTARRGLLLRQRDEEVRTRAEKLFGPEAVGARGEVIAKYRPALSLEGQPVRGAVVYRRECMNCHKVGTEGHDVGPNLATIRHRSPEEIMVHILDPNREVAPSYLDYVVILKDGRSLTGVIAGEAGNSLTLKRAQGTQETILREDIEEMANTGKSIMPEGLEQKIPPQEMADLLAFLLRLE